MKTERFKNPWFWVGLVGIILSASGVDPQTFTSWGALWDGILSVLQNPVQLAACFMAGLGVFVNPNTKGISDKGE